MAQQRLQEPADINRIAVLGGLVASLGFFFFPLIELKPNRLASGIPFNLLQLEGDLRYILLFGLAITPLIIALRTERDSRGWLLVGVGNVLLFLTLLLPALAGQQLLENAAAVLGEGVNLRNPRLLPSTAIALGLFGGYMVLFAGLGDLTKSGASLAARIIAGSIGVVGVVLLFTTGRMEIYSVMVEFRTNGGQLGRQFTEHMALVAVSLVVGLIVGIGLGLWASRDELMANIILYAVGIIQTIPSLALFGILLVPLARLGNQTFISVMLFTVVVAIVAAAVSFIYRLLAVSLAPPARNTLLIISALLFAVPLAVITVIMVSFLFRITLLSVSEGANMMATLAPGSPTVATVLGYTNGALLTAVIVYFANRYFVDEESRLKDGLRYFMYGTLVFWVISLIPVVFAAGQQQLVRVQSFETLTVRDLGVSGIGTAPALIALTLYSLLPLVRNTYAGLNNVDPAIIDSGRGMGMTPAQIFFSIELPLAFPVIMAGVRNAGVALVSIATIASVIGAGGLGDLILGGIINTSIDQILLGSIPAIAVAFALDLGLRGLEVLFTSPGIRQ